MVDGDPDATEGDYPAIKRGAELGILAFFPDALLARPGLILGPGEDIGRLPWWLARAAAGGRMVAPGRRIVRCSTWTSVTWLHGCSVP